MTPAGAHRRAQQFSPNSPDTLCYRIRKRLDWTQAEMAREMGTAEETIRNWERGRTPLPVFREKLERIASANRIKAPK